MIARRRPARSWAQAALAVGVALTLVACGSDGPNDPTPSDQTPTVTAIAPGSGTTLGGTAVTITGRNFTAGASVVIGGVAATNVVVAGATSITAVTAQHAAGAADVVVTTNGRNASLPGGFTYAAPSQSSNAPPTITGISSRSARPNVPTRFADLDETITLTATVTDAETASDQLKYEWTPESGTIGGTGREVTWRAPAQASTPAVVRIALVVTETYQTTNGQGLPTTAENKASSTVEIRLHASAKEVRDMAVDFLVEFSQQRLSPEQIIRNFTDRCPGRSGELSDVRNNQRDFTITSYTVEANPPVEIAFGGVCRNRGRAGDACAYVPVRWQSTEKATGKAVLSFGTDQVNAVYEDSRWKLCDSDFIGTTTIDGRATLRTFKK